MGVKTLSPFGNFFNFLGFLRKKLQNPSLEKFLDTPLPKPLVLAYQMIKDINYFNKVEVTKSMQIFNQDFCQKFKFCPVLEDF